MNRQRDLELIFRSRTPIVVIETGDEARVLDMIMDLTLQRNRQDYVPLFRWTVTDGLQRLDISLEPQLHNSDPEEVLRHIRAVTKPGVYVLLDFHPYLQDPVKVRLLKDICIRFTDISRQLILISHRIELPSELDSYAARFEMTLPSPQERMSMIEKTIADYSQEHPGHPVQVDPRAMELLASNLAGLSFSDTERLARNAVYMDGAIAHSDLPAVMEAKYRLLNRDGILQYEYDTARFSDVGGFGRLKAWLSKRRGAFEAATDVDALDAPKGILLLGVQGCGKSLAAKATAGVFGVPLLRLDFAALYNKYHGETERNLRTSLRTADTMAPCVLWIDEIEKGLAGRGGETGTTQRVLGSFLTWLAEKSRKVFVVATANDIKALPPELVRKGRFDEVFFVDLPSAAVRKSIFEIHLTQRGQDLASIDTAGLAKITAGFSGAEIEQIVVAALYSARAAGDALGTRYLAQEIRQTKPLSVLMREDMEALRLWAQGRAVAAD
ncbi:MAG: AAA family ATPase [Gammaproteobacteria bacterium]|nr:AAA family ATPase [Gammaproteobacteria bacterium]MDH4255685.1 AAA family ATPase [Gammaproteobacteria bacterium]MDH5308716.1 AAA family ATPase [Gammaproteobacteria bacterium]